MTIRSCYWKKILCRNRRETAKELVVYTRSVRTRYVENSGSYIMVDSIALVECDVVADPWVKTSFGECETDFICSITTSVADVDELCDERKLVLLHLPIRDDRRCQVRKC